MTNNRGPKYFPEEPCRWLAHLQTTHSHNMCDVSYPWCKSKTTEASSRKQIPESLRKRIQWSTVGKALAKSKNTSPCSLPCSIFNKISSAEDVSADKVENTFLNNCQFHDGAMVRPLAFYQCSPVPYVCWVCCWLSPCSKGFFLQVLQFSLSAKTDISKFQFD